MNKLLKIVSTYSVFILLGLSLALTFFGHFTEAMLVIIMATLFQLGNIVIDHLTKIYDNLAEIIKILAIITMMLEGSYKRPLKSEKIKN